MQNSEPYRTSLYAVSHQANGISSIPLAELSEQATALLKNLMPDVLERPVAFDVDRFIASNEYLTVQECDMPIANINGVIAVGDMRFYTSSIDYIPLSEGMILINKKLASNSAECRFTKIYLVACWLLYQLYRPFFVDCFACSKTSSTREDFIDANTLERFLKSTPDALDMVTFDIFTCMLGMPTQAFVPAAKAIMKKHGFGYKYISDKRRKNEFDEVIDELATIYDLPTYAVSIHLQTVGLFVDYGT